MIRETNTHLVRRALLIALIFQIAWIITAVLSASLGLKVQWGLLVANMLTLWAPALFILLTRSSLPEGFQVCFAIFITASSLIGSSLGGYGAIANWDTIVHVYSGAMLAWFGFIVVGKAGDSVKKPLPLWFKNSVAFMTPLAFAAVWEIYEFTSDALLHTNMQAGGLEDTIVDMAAAFVGAAVAIIVSTIWVRAAVRKKS